MKDPECIMSLISKYGTLDRVEDEKRREYGEGGNKLQRLFKYPEFVRNQFPCREAVDARDSSRMYPIAMEETWKTNTCQQGCSLSWSLLLRLKFSFNSKARVRPTQTFSAYFWEETSACVDI